MEIPMKTITSLLTAVILVSGAASAMADQQRSDEAPGYALSRQLSRESIVDRGAYASTRREPNVGVKSRLPVGNDFGNDQNIIDFQEQGSH
jgi:hypothetical protein